MPNENVRWYQSQIISRRQRNLDRSLGARIGNYVLHRIERSLSALVLLWTTDVRNQ